MTPQIKQRIEQIRRGEVPEGYKKTKLGIVPNEWEEIRFKNMFSRVTRKNKENNDNVLTISAQYGLINQRDFFNKDIASDDKSNYYLLENGEFAYNKSYSNGYPYGALKRLDMYDKGIVSPLYICFAANEENKCPDFYIHYFEAGKMNREIQAFAQEGARNHGLLNISVDDFFNSNIVAPSLPEQEKIAEILSAQDKLIALKEKLLEEKRRQKKALMQQLLTGKKRLPGFSGEWKKYGFDQIFNTISTQKYQISSEEYLEKAHYPVVDQGKKKIVAYSNNHEKVLKIPTGGVIVFGDHTREVKYINFDFVIGADGTQVLKSKNDIASTTFLYYLLSNKTIVSDGYSRHFKYIKEFVYFVPNVGEQQTIVNILSMIDREIELIDKELDQEKQRKKALMQLLLTGIVRVDI